MKSNNQPVFIHFVFPALMILSAVVFYPLSASADDGRIITVNDRLNIAFTDLTNKKLQTGDTVNVRRSDKTLAVMRVVQTTDVLSKLVPGTNESGQFDLEGFQSIRIGDQVRLRESVTGPVSKKKSTSPEVNPEAEAYSENPDREFGELSRKYVTLSVSLAESMQQNNELKGRVEGLNSEVERLNQEIARLRESAEAGPVPFRDNGEEPCDEARVSRLKQTIIKIQNRMKNMDGLLGSAGEYHE